MAPPKRSTGPSLWLWAILAGIIAIIAVLAIALSGDDEKTATPATTPAPGSAAAGSAGTTAARGSGAVAPAENQPVAVTGAALPATDLDTLASPFDDPAIGQTAPTLAGHAFDGSPMTIDPAKGPLMVVFLAHWCPHCNREIPVLRQWKDSGGVPDGLQVIAVSTAVTSAREHFPPSQWLKQLSWPWPAMADSAKQAAARAYGVGSYPYFVVIGADGKVKVRNAGEITVTALTELVNRALNS